MGIRFAHISPTAFLDKYTSTNGAHLILAHLVESDPEYRDFYANLDDGKEKIMDNSAFEMYKQGRSMYPTDRLLDMGRQCGADMIVMSDYPGQKAQVTIDAAIATAEVYHHAGFRTFFVPQSQVGDLEDYMYGMQWALSNPQLVDRIGLSILGCPNAYGVERDNKLQRYLSRYSILNEIYDRGLLNPKDHGDIFHCLGMVDGPKEIELLKDFHHYIATWDSSAAVWAGIHGISFDDSPTGLVGGKFELEVDFDYNKEHIEQDVLHNISIIDGMV